MTIADLRFSRSLDHQLRSTRRPRPRRHRGHARARNRRRHGAGAARSTARARRAHRHRRAHRGGLPASLSARSRRCRDSRRWREGGAADRGRHRGRPAVAGGSGPDGAGAVWRGYRHARGSGELRAGRGSAAGAPSRRAVAASVCVSGPSARMVDRDSAGLSVPLLVLFDLAAARALGSRAFDRIGVPGLRRVRGSRIRRRRSVLVPPAAQPRAREGAAPPRHPEAVDPRAEPRRSGRAECGASRGLAPDGAGFRYLLRPRGRNQRRAHRPEEGRDRRSHRTGRGGCARR